MTRLFARLILTFSFCLYIFLVHAQVNWESQLRPILSDSLLKRAQVGISIRNIQSDKLVFEQNATQSFTPASNLKLVTTAATLEGLGADYRFKTSVMYSGEIAAGIFNGVLLVKGSGDPTLGSDKMPKQLNYQTLIKNWITAFKLKGVTTFKGNLLIDATHFGYNPVPKDYTWGDIGNYYGAGSFGLNLNENQYVATFKPGVKPGAPATVISLVPWDTSCIFINHVITGPAGTGDQSIIYGSPYNNLIYAEGSIPIGNNYLVKGSIQDPARILAQLMIAEMKAQGIVWSGTYSIVNTDENIQAAQWQILTEQYSPVLKDIADYTNLVSNNLYAECMLKELAYIKTGKGITESGTNQIKKYLSSIGIDTLGIILRDGSGMSPFNAVSPNQLTQLLGTLYSNAIFVSCLPVAGSEGTVSHTCKETNGSIKVKSGTMNGTTCYSGYVRANSGISYAVSLMVNKHEAKNRQIQRVLEKVLLKILEN